MTADLEKRLREQAKQLREYLGPCDADYTVLVSFAETCARIGAEIEREGCIFDILSRSAGLSWADDADWAVSVIRARGGAK